jgi:leucyl aminopeptidase
MPFTISMIAEPKTAIPFVFFVFNDDRDDPIAGKYSFSLLKSPERVYLKSAAIVHEVKLKEKEAKVLIMPGTGRRVIVVGLGNHSELTPKKIAIAFRIAVRTARKERIERFACEAPTQKTSTTIETYEVIATNAVMANFEFVHYITPPPEGFAFMKEIQLIAPADALPRDIRDRKEGIRRGMIIGEETNACRMLANMPGGDMTPAMLTSHALAIAKKNGGIKATILGVDQMKKLGMGGVLGVGKGSDVPPRFIILEYMRGGKSEKPIVLVCKGVTFDTGGLNLKPSEHIYEMHMDMSGGAAVIHTLVAAARLGLKKNIVALVPAVENMPSGSSYRPGDLLRTMNGKTIEVLDTDAEGRVILADALEYSKKYNPSLVIDVATLTGAAQAALGVRYTGLFTADKKMEEKFRAIGDVVNDPVWPLPLSEDYESEIKGTFADWANIGKSGRGGGASTAAVFLWQFIKGYPWVHLDIAPRMTSIDDEYLAKGALGTPVRLLARFLEED